MQALRKLLAAFWQKPRLVLSLCTLMWAGNGVAGRAIAGQMSPMLLVTARWSLVFVILSVMLLNRWHEIKAVIFAHPWRIGLMGSIGFTGFNVLFYAAAYYTTAVNMNLLQSAIPIFVFLGALMFMGTPVTLLQSLGVGLSVLGAILVTTAGQPQNLLAMHFNKGDLMLVLACACYAGYTLAIRWLCAVAQEWMGWCSSRHWLWQRCSRRSRFWRLRHGAARSSGQLFGASASSRILQCFHRLWRNYFTCAALI